MSSSSSSSLSSSSSWSNGPPLLGRDALEAGIRAGNINIASKVNVEVMDLNEESKASQAQHEEVMRRYEAQKRARSIAVPTATEEVKAMLRVLSQPVTLFGENPMDRRDRLRGKNTLFDINYYAVSYHIISILHLHVF